MRYFTRPKWSPRGDQVDQSDGDGEYKITVSNPTDQPLTVDALRREGKRVLWKESLVILCQGQAYTRRVQWGCCVPHSRWC